jgi:hypothetical protein
LASIGLAIALTESVGASDRVAYTGRRTELRSPARKERFTMIERMEGQTQSLINHATATDEVSFEPHFEETLEHVRQVLEDFRDCAWMVWSDAEREVRATADALCAKEEAIRWKLKIAKHCSGPVRAALLFDAQKSVAELEESAVSTLRAVARYQRHN